jgi:hypothetical protein
MRAALRWHFGLPDEARDLTAAGRRDRALKEAGYDRDAYMKDRWEGDHWRKSRQTRALYDLERRLDHEEPASDEHQPAKLTPITPETSQFEYEIVDRALSCVIASDDHTRTTYRNRVHLRCLGQRVRLFETVYKRVVSGEPPGLRVLSDGHRVLNERPICEAPPTMLDVPRYVSFVYLGRPHGPGEFALVEYEITFKDEHPPDPSYSILIRARHPGRLDFTIELPAAYTAKGVAFTVSRGPTGDIESQVLWRPDQGFTRERHSQSVELAGDRADIDWDIETVGYGLFYEIRWTNEAVTSLFEGIRP